MSLVCQLQTETRGTQEGPAYHGSFRRHMHHLLLVFDAETGQLVTAVLRRGTAHAGHGLADRLSCHRFAANQVRLLHGVAYCLLDTLRHRLAGVGAARLHLDTLRLRLIKIGGRVHELADRAHLRLASSHPGEPPWRLLAARPGRFVNGPGEYLRGRAAGDRTGGAPGDGEESRHRCRVLLEHGRLFDQSVPHPVDADDGQVDRVAVVRAPPRCRQRTTRCSRASSTSAWSERVPGSWRGAQAAS